MDFEIINRLVSFWRKSFFIEPIVILSFIFCFIIGLLYHNKERERFFFLLYFFTGIMLFILTSLILELKILTGRKLNIFSEITNTIFELSEFIAFYHFFKKSLHRRRFKKIAKILLLFLCIVISIFFIRLAFPHYAIADIKKHSLFINATEFFFLSVLCLAYFFELFTGIPKIDLTQRPSFFIVTSTFFYAVIMIPFFTIAHEIFRI